jgi:hypothetical protein
VKKFWNGYDDERRLKLWTNFALLVAVAFGLTVACLHGGRITVSTAAFGAALGLGGVLGFLFGVPTAPNASATVVLNKDGDSDVIAESAGPGKASATAEATGAETDGGADDAVEKKTGVGLAAKDGLSKGETNSGANGGAGNTVSNLEQVADWVTKLLLGGGLTQIQNIPPKVWQWSRNVAVGINGSSEQIVEADQAFAAGLLVYGFVLGFFAGFLITKLQLGKAIQG